MSSLCQLKIYFLPVWFSRPSLPVPSQTLFLNLNLSLWFYNRVHVPRAAGGIHLGTFKAPVRFKCIILEK
jgi:hypothetical protein